MQIKPNLDLHEHQLRGLIMETLDTWQTQARGALQDEYKIYLACADDGNGGDITRNGAPLLSYEEWLSN